MKTTGIIVGRFQIDDLHGGHISLINRVRKLCDQVVLIIGKSPAPFTNRNPIPAELTAAYLTNKYIIYDVIWHTDHKSDWHWSESLDKLLDRYPNVTLYHSRDSFVKHYLTKKYPTVELPALIEDSSTKRREIIKAVPPLHSKDFRAGIIYATQARFPIVYPTVDIAVLKVTSDINSNIIGKKEVLLVRKAGFPKWHFPGGFVDRKDTSLYAAASRELNEELPHLETHEFKLIGSSRIDDWRYRGTQDSIMTTLFLTYMMGGNTNLGDDLKGGSAQFFDIERKDLVDLVDECHLKLLGILLTHIHNEERNNRH